MRWAIGAPFAGFCLHVAYGRDIDMRYVPDENVTAL
jgi:hypothetical protein